MFAGEFAFAGRRVRQHHHQPRNNALHQSDELMNNSEQVVDEDDEDGWLGETITGPLLVCERQQASPNEDNELGKAAGRETPDRLTLDYVNQLVAALQETRRHLDSLAEFVSNELLKTSRSNTASVEEARPAEATDQIPWEIMHREWEFPDLMRVTNNRSIGTQTENSNARHESVAVAIRPRNSRESQRTGGTSFNFEEIVDSRPAIQTKPPPPKNNAGKLSSWKSEAIVQAMLNEISISFQKRTRNRMSIIGHHYRKLYWRHLKLRRRFRNQKRRYRHAERQHQILLESIGDQVDELALDWARRVRHLLKATAPNAHQLDDDEDDGEQLWRRRRVNKDSVRSVAWQQWHAVLSLKLDWVRSSHGTVVDHLLVRLAKQL